MSDDGEVLDKDDEFIENDEHEDIMDEEVFNSDDDCPVAERLNRAIEREKKKLLSKLKVKAIGYFLNNF